MQEVLSLKVGTRLTGNDKYIDVDMEGAKFKVSIDPTRRRDIIIRDSFGAQIECNGYPPLLLKYIYNSSIRRMVSMSLLMGLPQDVHYEVSLPKTEELESFLAPFLETERAHQGRPDLANYIDLI